MHQDLVSAGIQRLLVEASWFYGLVSRDSVLRLMQQRVQRLEAFGLILFRVLDAGLRV